MKKKILIVASTYIHLEHFHLPYINNLKEDYDVKTLSGGYGIDNNYADFVINFKKKILSVSNFALVKKIKKILVDGKFDIVFLNTCLASFFVRLAIKGMKKEDRPVVINIVHGYLFSNSTNFIKKRFYITAEKFVKNQTDKIVVMNDEDNMLAQKYKLTSGEIYKINGMGVNTKRLTIDGAYNYEKNANEVVFSYIGELNRRKNQKFIIKFIKKLKEQNENPKLYLIGTGVQDKYLKKYAKKLGVIDNLVFVGYDRNIAPYLLQSDYYISASKVEGLPFNIVESMFMGKIVFASDVKGCNDIIDSGENAFLYKCFDIDDLLKKYNQVKSNLDLKKDLTLRAKKSIEKYTIENVFDDNIKLFRKFIDET